MIPGSPFVAVAGLVVIVIGIRVRLPKKMDTKAMEKQERRRAGGEKANTDSSKVSINTKKGLHMSMMYLNQFLGWDCSRALLKMELFPDAKEITESVGCLWAVKQHMDSISWQETEVTCIVVGDGIRPRTAALACFLTNWRRVISIDPLISEHTEKEFASYGIDGLEMRGCKIQDTVVDIDPELDRAVLIILPHAHVTPNTALSCLRIRATTLQTKLPRIAVCQIPCCTYEFHDRCAAQAPNKEYSDHAIASAERLVRCWWDVATPAYEQGAIRVGKAAPIVQLGCPESSSTNRKERKIRRKQAKPKQRKIPQTAEAMLAATAAREAAAMTRRTRTKRAAGRSQGR
jgi:hypothetical protein